MLCSKQSFLDTDKKPDVLIGIWINPIGECHLSLEDSFSQQRLEKRSSQLYFAWSTQVPQTTQVLKWEKLEGDGIFQYLLYFSTFKDYRDFIKSENKSTIAEYIPCLENQYLLMNKKRLFEGLPFKALKRCQCHIQTTQSSTVENTPQAEDRIFSISLQFTYSLEPFFLILEEMTDEAECALLKTFNKILEKYDPDVIEGHDIFNTTLYQLSKRCQQLQVPCQWGRFGQTARWYESRLVMPNRSIDFIRYDLPGRTVFDTALAAQMLDSITTRDCPEFDLKTVFSHLGMSAQQSSEKEIFLDGKKAQEIHLSDRDTFHNHQSNILYQIHTIANVLLPTYFAQLSHCPMTLQEVYLRGPAGKINLMFLEDYYHSKHSLPQKKPVKPFSGGFTHNFVEGVFYNVAHFDVISLYPTLLLNLDRNPSTDMRKVFIPLLKKLTQQRLHCKKLLSLSDPKEKAQQLEYKAQESSLKILINSFYGYLGYDGARFSDSDLAAEITAQGRELLQRLIKIFHSLGASVLEADTDGFFAILPEEHQDVQKLLNGIKNTLPNNIELEYRGSYISMLCYKSKNYALFDGKKVLKRGSALRARNTEPYIETIRDRYIAYALGIKNDAPEAIVAKLRSEIIAQRLPVSYLAKTEYLNQDLQSYQKNVTQGGKPHRSSMEAALKIDPKLKAGEKITYYMTQKKKKNQPNWQLAQPLKKFDPVEYPYDTQYYMQKLEHSLKQLQVFVRPSQDNKKVPIQGELF